MSQNVYLGERCAQREQSFKFLSANEKRREDSNKSCLFTIIYIFTFVTGAAWQTFESWMLKKGFVNGERFIYANLTLWTRDVFHQGWFRQRYLVGYLGTLKNIYHKRAKKTRRIKIWIKIIIIRFRLSKNIF